ncbi:Hypothetical predicted protein [Podarcis lilfordi]|uniref:Uncharacterized protein n=1 Tax=Podarcis lilfordi TaxID=74358 RepID=A0AA35JWT7_9SAUR|nr:Hypothetical predicted protein [Podarcis lilfordi]
MLSRDLVRRGEGRGRSLFWSSTCQPLCARLDRPVGLVLTLAKGRCWCNFQFIYLFLSPLCLALSKFCLFDVVPIYLPFELFGPSDQELSPTCPVGEFWCCAQGREIQEHGRLLTG